MLVLFSASAASSPGSHGSDIFLVGQATLEGFLVAAFDVVLHPGLDDAFLLGKENRHH